MDFLDDKIVDIAKDKEFDKIGAEKVFVNTFQLLGDALGEDAFRKYYSKENKHKGGFSIALFEAISVGISRNLDRIKGCDRLKLKQKIEKFSLESKFISSSGSGVRGNTRIINTIPFAIDFFANE